MKNLKKQVKKQHFVPQFYLRSFSLNNDKKRIFAFDKTNNSKYIQNISDAACSKYFYDIDDIIERRFEEAQKLFEVKYHRLEFTERQAMEKGLSKNESLFGPVYDKLISTKNLASLTNAEKATLAGFISFQMVRTDRYREEMIEPMLALQKIILEQGTKELQEQINEVCSEDSIRYRHIKAIQESTTEYAKIFYDHLKWQLMINSDVSDFWTSDHPVVKYNPNESNDYGNLGLLCEGIQVYFPLTPKLCLRLLSPEYEISNAELTINSPEQIVFTNYLQLTQSKRHLFSRTDDFDFAEKLLSDNANIRLELYH